MAAAWGVYRQHGAQCLVISGGVSTRDEVDLNVRQIPDAEWTIVRLRIHAAERRARTAQRSALLGGDPEDIDDLVAAGIEDEAHLETQDFPDLMLDTDGLDRQAVVDLVLERTGWPGP